MKLLTLPSSLSAVDRPRITSQPLDMLNVIPGNNVMFTVAASGLRLTYTWMQNGSTLPSDGRFVAVDEMLTIQSVMPSDVGNYSCVVSNAAGDETSDPARLTLSELVFVIKRFSYIRQDVLFVCCERQDHTYLLTGTDHRLGTMHKNSLHYMHVNYLPHISKFLATCAM